MNSEIDKELREDKKKLKNRVKILLLGCGEAGKVGWVIKNILA